MIMYIHSFSLSFEKGFIYSFFLGERAGQRYTYLVKAMYMYIYIYSQRPNLTNQSTIYEQGEDYLEGITYSQLIILMMIDQFKTPLPTLTFHNAIIPFYPT